MRNALKHFHCLSSQLADVERSIKLWKLLLCDLYTYMYILVLYILMIYLTHLWPIEAEFLCPL